MGPGRGPGRGATLACCDMLGALLHGSTTWQYNVCGPDHAAGRLLTPLPAHGVSWLAPPPAGSNVIDAEYLKNTLIKLFVTGEAEALLPVFATILSFSPAEVQRCREGLAAIKRVRTWWGVGGREGCVEGREAGRGPCDAEHSVRVDAEAVLRPGSACCSILSASNIKLNLSLLAAPPPPQGDVPLPAAAAAVDASLSAFSSLTSWTSWLGGGGGGGAGGGAGR